MHARPVVGSVNRPVYNDNRDKRHVWLTLLFHCRAAIRQTETPAELRAQTQLMLIQGCDIVAGRLPVHATVTPKFNLQHLSCSLWFTTPKSS